MRLDLQAGRIPSSRHAQPLPRPQHPHRHSGVNRVVCSSAPSGVQVGDARPSGSLVPRPSRICGDGQEAPPILILPGFLTSHGLYEGMSSCLRDLGFGQVSVVPITQRQWWPTLYGGHFEFYLEALKESLMELREASGGRKVALVGHSAGGWLARIALGAEPYNGRVFDCSSHVRHLLTLGSPHQTIEAYPFGRKPERRSGEAATLTEDVRGSSVRFANHHYPTADAFPGIRMTCVVGKAVRGAPLDLTSLARSLAQGPVGLGQAMETSLEEYSAFVSYTANRGDGNDEGDGVCPVECGIVPGAKTLVLPGVRHLPQQKGQKYGGAAAPVGEGGELAGAGVGGTGKCWYGSPEIVTVWARELCEDVPDVPVVV